MLELEPTDLILNSGMWESFNAPHLYEPLITSVEQGASEVATARAARGEPSSLPRLYWRTTQATVPGSSTNYLEPALVSAVRARNWSVIENGQVSAALCKFALRGTAGPWDAHKTAEMTEAEYEAWCNARARGDAQESFAVDAGSGRREPFVRADGPLFPGIRDSDGLFISENHLHERLYKGLNHHLLAQLCGDGTLAQCPILRGA